MGKGSDRLSYGITILIFGVIFLLDSTGLLAQIPYGTRIMSVSVFILIAGVVFLITQPKKILGWLFTGIGLFLNAGWVFGWVGQFSNYLIPAALIIVGVVMVFFSKK